MNVSTAGNLSCLVFSSSAHTPKDLDNSDSVSATISFDKSLWLIPGMRCLLEFLISVPGQARPASTMRCHPASSLSSPHRARRLSADYRQVQNPTRGFSPSLNCRYEFPCNEKNCLVVHRLCRLTYQIFRN